jgi:hypothetical protein
MADDVVKIEVKPRPARKLTFDLGGEIYTFSIPKVYGLIETIKEAQIGTGSGVQDAEAFGKIEDWLFSSLSLEEAQRIKERLRDEEDDLDLEHVLEIFQALTKAASDRPSGSRRSA